MSQLLYSRVVFLLFSAVFKLSLIIAGLAECGSGTICGTQEFYVNSAPVSDGDKSTTHHTNLLLPRITLFRSFTRE